MTSPRCPRSPRSRASSARASRPPSLAVLALAGLALVGCGGSGGSSKQPSFDAGRAMSLVRQQVAIGPRPAGSPQLRRLADRLRGTLPNGTLEPFPSKGPQQGLRNVLGDIPGHGPAIVIGAHYDTQYRPKG